MCLGHLVHESEWNCARGTGALAIDNIPTKTLEKGINNYVFENDEISE